jgi:hypothetical protein
LASQSLISAVNSYDNYIQRKGIDEQVIDAYIQALSVAFRSENDVKYGLQQSAKTKSLIAKYVKEKTGGRVADLEVYAGDNDTSYKILDQFYNLLIAITTPLITGSTFCNTGINNWPRTIPASFTLFVNWRIMLLGELIVLAKSPHDTLD